MKFAIPFDYSMHNYLLRYYLAEHGVDPDTDVQLRSVPPPEMVANLRADNIDGFLAPDNICQRAIYDGVGFLHILSKEIWDGHPCCSFAASREFITTSPNSFAALTRAIVDATAYASKAENRKQIAEAIAPANYLNAPVTVLEQVLTGTYADGLGGVKTDPKRVDFDPFPWQSFAVWMLTQMKRWGQINGEVDYKSVAEQVYLATDMRKVMAEMGLTPPATLLQILFRHGQAVRSGEARGLSQQLQDQEGIVRSAEYESDSLFSPGARGGEGQDDEFLSSLSRSDRIGRAVPGIYWCLAHRHARHFGCRKYDPGICEVDGAFGDAGQIGDARSDRRRREIMGAPKRPFYDNGPNDKGLGIQLGYSIARVGLGYFLAVIVAIPLGFLIGMSPLINRALDPFIQILKPISPLAWMPLALYTIKDSGLSAIFVIFICSVWPMLLNTAFGVASVRKEWINVARTLEVGTVRRAFTVILPAAAPTILTGMRISIGIAWLVIVAAEMLVGGTGIGYFVWNEWNNLSITNVIIAILLIGVVGMLLDQILARFTRLVTFPE